MVRSFLSAAVVLVLTGLMAVVGQEAKDKSTKEGKDKAGKGQEATITKVDAKNGTVTVRMKGKDGKEVNKEFKLTGDIRYFDSTGKAAAIDFFQSGDDVLMIEADGQIKELCHQGEASSGNRDQDFLKAAARIDLAELKLGRLAEDVGGAAAIKKFGERIVSDHARMNKELMQMAKSQGMTLPDKLDKKHQELYDQLSKLKGADFDRTFSKDMVSGHEKAIMKFESEAKNGKAADIKAWAEKWLPALREHLQLARSAVKEVNTGR